MSNKQILNLFCDTFNEFLTDLYNVYPTDNTIYAMKTAVYSATLLTPETLLNQFIVNIHPYEQLIDGRHCEELISIINKEKKHQEGFIHDGINNVLCVWMDADDTTKECIFRYIQLLIKISKKY